MERTSVLLYFVIFFEITALIADARPGRRDCHDTFHSCASWSKAGMCENIKFGFVMKGGCAKTCGFCKKGFAHSITKTHPDGNSGQASEGNEKRKSDSENSTAPSKRKKCVKNVKGKDFATSHPCTGPTEAATLTTPTTVTTPTTPNTPTTATTPTTQTTPTTPTTATSPTTLTTHTTPTTRRKKSTKRTTKTKDTTPTTVTTPTTPTTATTATTHTTPTTPTTFTTPTTEPTLSTPTTSTTSLPPYLDKKKKTSKTKKDDEDDTKRTIKKCQDLFTKCQEWKEGKDICTSPKFKPYMEFGCARSCSLCTMQSEAERESFLDDDTVNVEVGQKKSLLAVWPVVKRKDVDSQLDDVVEIGIAREMIEENEKPGNKTRPSRKTSRKQDVRSEKRSMTPRNKILHKNYQKNKEKSSLKEKTRRVEIEDGFKNSNPFSSINEVASNFDKMDLQNAVLGSETRDLSAEDSDIKANALDALDKGLPDFNGLDNVDDVQKILETPKPKKKLDYYVEHFSNDPYVAESEKEQWLKDNSVRPKEYRRGLEVNSQGKVASTSPNFSPSSDPKHSMKKELTESDEAQSPNKKVERKHNEKVIRKSSTKRVEIENGFNEPSPFANFDGVAHEDNQVDLHSPELGSEADKTNEVDSLTKLPDFDGLNNRKDVQELFETPTNKNFDYYVEHFSSDPYLAESEKEQWLKDNEMKGKQYRRRLKVTKIPRKTRENRN